MLKPKAAKYISAVIASILTSAPVATVSYGQTRAAEECISSPKGTAPEGSHWYYRVDRATKRHCWYLGESGGKVSRVRTPSHRVARSIAPEPEPTQRLVADAHAELPARTSIEQPNGAGRPNWPLQADAANASAAPLANEAGAVIASRWPDGSSVSSPAAPATDPAANVQPTGPAAPPLTVAAMPTAAEDPQDAWSSMPMLLAAIACALALAGIAASLVLRIGGVRGLRPAKVRSRRGCAWEATDDDTILVTDLRAADIRPRPSAFARNYDQTGEAKEKIRQIFSRHSRPARG